MTDSDDLMDAFPGFSTNYHKNETILSKKKKKLITIKDGKIFLGDYLMVSFVIILRINTSPCIITF